jgi:hypothetical protein
MTNLAYSRARLWKIKEAITLQEEVVAIMRRTPLRSHAHFPVALKYLAELYAKDDRLAEADAVRVELGTIRTAADAPQKVNSGPANEQASTDRFPANL